MPVLTARKDPEEFNDENSDEPNEYAIRYLFASNSPNVELERTGRMFLYAAAAANLLALALYASWQEFRIDPFMLTLSVAIVLASGLAAWQLKKRSSVALPLSYVPLVMTTIILTLLTANAAWEQAYLFFFFMPGSFVMALSVLPLFVAWQRRKASLS